MPYLLYIVYSYIYNLEKELPGNYVFISIVLPLLKYFWYLFGTVISLIIKRMGQVT